MVRGDSPYTELPLDGPHDEPFVARVLFEHSPYVYEAVLSPGSGRPRRARVNKSYVML